MSPPLCAQCEFCLSVDCRQCRAGRTRRWPALPASRHALSDMHDSTLTRAVLHVYVHSIRNSSDCGPHPGVMDTSQQRLQARCQRQRDQRRRSSRAVETAEQRETRLQRERDQRRNRMAAETAEQREARLQRDRDQRRSRRAAETAVVLHV